MASRPLDLWSSSNIALISRICFAWAASRLGPWCSHCEQIVFGSTQWVHWSIRGETCKPNIITLVFFWFFYGTPSDSVWISWKRSRGFPSEIVWVLFGISYRCLWHFADFLWVLHAIPWILNGLSSGFVCVIYCVDFLRVWYGLLWDFCIGILEFVCWFLADVV